jgi:hypothetical protein
MNESMRSGETMMKQHNSALGLVVLAGCIAATLQGSRLPDEAVYAGRQVAQACDTADYRAGSGSDREEYPPLPEGVLA